MREESESLFRAFERAISAKAGDLSSRGIAAGVPEHNVRNEAPDQFTSEASIFFFKNGEIIDAFEFFLFKEGRQQVTRDEIESWVSEQLSTVI